MDKKDRYRMSEWKKKLRTDIYNYKKQARRFFSLPGVVRIRGEKWWDKSAPKEKEK